MASPEVLDFANLVAPIPGDNPAGVDLRSDSSSMPLYHAVKDARSAARSIERQFGMGDEEGGGRPDWKPVLTNGTKVIAQKSKDLEMVAYLIEALARIEGFAGLRDGFRLARELVEQYWDNLYPMPDEEGIETRVAPLTGLNGEDAEGTLIAPIAKIPITEGSSVGPFALYHHQQASTIAQIADEEAREKKIRHTGLSPADFETAVSETSARFFGGLVEDITQAMDEFNRLGAALEEKCGGKAPPASNIRNVLSNCLEAVKFIGRDKLSTLMPADDLSAPVGAPGDAAPAAGGGGPAVAATATAVGDIRTRDDAFRALLKVAEFFRRNEPHTPVSYSLEQAVRWGRMPLPDLLRELIPDDSSRQQLFKQVGIRDGNE
jgi:type VI secretion system protein ImpA